MLALPPLLMLALLPTLRATASTIRGLDAGPKHPVPRTYDTHSYYAIELHPAAGSSAGDAAAHLGLELVEPLGELAHHYLARLAHADHDRRGGEAGMKRSWRALRKRSAEVEAVRGLELMQLRKRTKREWVEPAPHDRFALRGESMLDLRQQEAPGDGLPAPNMVEFDFMRSSLKIADPLLARQWHLVNTEMPENEMNVSKLWDQGITGTGVRVALIDDGLDYTSLDLKDNFYADGSYDFNDHEPLPTPKLSDDTHGTRCAGEIAAVRNDVCGVGVAYTSSVAGIRILSGPISDADEAAALNFGYQTNQIYSCSWGPPDNGREMDAPEGLILKAMVNGAMNGRGGKGSVFVFAAGNGGGMDDQCNFDGYTNSIYSVTIGAVDRKGLHPYYSEACAAVLAVAPSSGSGDHIHTTDVGENKCSDGHGGTSAAAPLAVGMVALALQVRPDLAWRDVQHLMVRGVDTFNDVDPDWETTAAGRKFNYKYGYGKLNAGKFVELAQDWQLVKPQAWIESDVQSVVTPENTAGQFITPEGVSHTYSVTADALKTANLERLEHVTVQVWIDHARRGDIEVELTSPKGVVSVLARTRRSDDATSGFRGWKFMSMKHWRVWEEDPVGDWTLKVLDRVNPLKNGTFQAWSLQLWGEAIDASKAVPYALPVVDEPEETDDNEDEASTSAMEVPIETTATTDAATKVLPKPTANLPSDHAAAPGHSAKPGLADPVLPTDAITSGANDPIGSQATPDEGTFDGIERLRSSTWVYGALGFIALAGLSGAAFFFLRNRRRRDSFGAGDERGQYGVLGGGDEGLSMGILGRSRRQRDGAKASELYDAFGDGTDSEHDSDGGDDRRGLEYHDSFLDDDDHSPRPSTSAAATYEEAEYDVEAEDREDAAPVDDPVGERSSGGSGGSAGSGSWQDVPKQP